MTACYCSFCLIQRNHQINVVPINYLDMSCAIEQSWTCYKKAYHFDDEYAHILMTLFLDDMFKVNLTHLYAVAFTITLINDWVEIFVYNFDKATGIIITSFVIRKQKPYNTLVYMKLNNTTTTSFTLKVFFSRYVFEYMHVWLKASEFMYVS